MKWTLAYRETSLIGSVIPSHFETVPTIFDYFLRGLAILCQKTEVIKSIFKLFQAPDL